MSIQGRHVSKLSGYAPALPKHASIVSAAAGDSFSIPPGTVHSVRNAGPGALTIISTYVVEKNKPIASPAP